MLTPHFFADRDFIDLLRFWEAGRHGRELPTWGGDIAAVPRAILPNLVLGDVRGDPLYLYVGAELARRWGSDSTGRRAFSDVLQGAHRRYIKSLTDQTMTRRAPIYSTAVYQTDAASMIMTGRLFAPFTVEGATDVQFIMTLQMFSGSEDLLRQVGISGIVHETRRDLITDVGLLCDRLEAARRDYQVARHTRDRTLAQDVDAVVEELTGRALVALPCLEEPDAIADA